ncbi:hypothetical protein EVAR_36545_1 [Eumeta japonica]|uniref:Uncharacterized protein n=1 Tax=Eumeta variegata TaxID=151549 RepID=A0A4C1ZBB3_EUMVA|nr:hypothetical protein EVAR_36545_1 [Eumeta japonica]
MNDTCVPDPIEGLRYVKEDRDCLSFDFKTLRDIVYQSEGLLGTRVIRASLASHIFYNEMSLSGRWRPDLEDSVEKCQKFSDTDSVLGTKFRQKLRSSFDVVSCQYACV